MKERINRHGEVFFARALKAADSLSRRAKVVILVIFDLTILTMVVFASFMIRFAGELSPSAYQAALLLAAPPLTCICLYALRTYGNVSRLHASSIEGAHVLAITLSALIWSFLILAVGAEGFPRSIVVLYGGLSIIVYISIRRMIAGLFRLAHMRRASEMMPVAIVGLNDFALNLVENLRAGGSRRPVAFIDTDRRNVGRRVAGLPVISAENLDHDIQSFDIDMVVLALPQRLRQRDRALVEKLTELQVNVQTIAPPEDILSGRVSISDIRSVSIEDVLGREPVAPDRNLMASAVSSNAVIVTGAGGSIGSELVRQILTFSPPTLILFELSELALYEIEREAREIIETSHAEVEIVPILGSVLDERLVKRVLDQYRPEVVLHAAAYKHVPLGEANSASCVDNNVFGAKTLADCAISAGVKLFVSISTDKAVRPTNIMGASKRMAELILLDRAATQSGTKFTMVRFGNVLGSSGSVIPLFKSQIAKGGPVTVTDPRMTRYFMTIPEAVELVLQAAGMAEGGEVYVLDMGKSVKIVSLARSLISLSNLTVRDQNNPQGDIEIVYSGIRPGEKLYEELLIGDNVTNTPHPRIMRCNEQFLSSAELGHALARLKAVIEIGDDAEIRRCLSDAVEGYVGSKSALVAQPAQASRPPTNGSTELSFGRKLFIEAHASTSAPSTEK